MRYESYHKMTNIKPSPPPKGHGYQFYGTDEIYVNFYLTDYRDVGKYPLVLLDVVGFWAKAEVFGGSVLFERENSLSEV